MINIEVIKIISLKNAEKLSRDKNEKFRAVSNAALELPKCGIRKTNVKINPTIEI